MLSKQTQALFGGQNRFAGVQELSSTVVLVLHVAATAAQKLWLRLTAPWVYVWGRSGAWPRRIPQSAVMGQAGSMPTCPRPVTNPHKCLWAFFWGGVDSWGSRCVVTSGHKWSQWSKRS